MVNATKQRVLQDHQRCPSRKATRQTCILLDVVSGKIKEVTLGLLKMGNATRHRVWFFKIAADVHLALLQNIGFLQVTTNVHLAKPQET